jgi:hypothetical protein
MGIKQLVGKSTANARKSFGPPDVLPDLQTPLARNAKTARPIHENLILVRGDIAPPSRLERGPRFSGGNRPVGSFDQP